MPLSLLPTLFVSHGAPLFALEPGQAGAELGRWAQSLRSAAPLRGVVLMSPHWMAATPCVMTSARPPTLHDFGGFPAALYALQYPVAGHPALAHEVLHLLDVAGITARADDQRALDHGAWVPLMHMFPQADVPVVQVALPARWGPKQVLAMGAALHSLRSAGVLLMGSGSMTHNLGEFFGEGQTTAPYVAHFCRWVEAALERGDTPALLDYRHQAAHAARAHPTEDHFLPLFFALGAAGAGARPHYLSREVRYGMLAMDSFALTAPAVAV